MPLRAEVREFYGAEWKAYRLVLIEMAQGKCQKCGVEHPMLNGAHTTHDPKDMALVAVWCPRCHGLNDAPHAYAVRRRTKAKKVGQLWLFPEVEYAPFPSWMIPKHVLTRGQGKLF